jgi:hypothetical protein
MKLHLGVIDQKYNLGGESTGDVAQYLEEKYHVMEVFAGSHIDQIAEDMADNVAGVLENIMAGGPVRLAPFDEAMGKTEARFHDFLTHEEMAGWPGVPTQAALDGRTSRRKNKRGPRRPSFIDTGLYFASFKSWID